MKRIRSLRDAEKQLEILREHIKKTEGSGKKQRKKTKKDEEITKELVEESVEENKQKNKYKKLRKQRNAAEELVKIYDLTKKRQRTGNLDNLQPPSSSPLRPLPQIPVKKENNAPLNSSSATPEKIKPEDDNHSSTLQTQPQAQTQPTDEPTTQPTDEPTTQPTEKPTTPVVRVKQPETEVKQAETEVKQPEMKQTEDKKEEDVVEEKDITIIGKTPSSSTGEILQEMDKNKKLEEYINHIDNEIEHYSGDGTKIPREDLHQMQETMRRMYDVFIFTLKAKLRKCVEKFRKEKTLRNDMQEIQDLQHMIEMCNKILRLTETNISKEIENFHSILKLSEELMKLVEK